jgi:hypothetical protein
MFSARKIVSSNIHAPPHQSPQFTTQKPRKKRTLIRIPLQKHQQNNKDASPTIQLKKSPGKKFIQP